MSEDAPVSSRTRSKKRSRIEYDDDDDDVIDSDLDEQHKLQMEKYNYNNDMNVDDQNNNDMNDDVIDTDIELKEKELPMTKKNLKKMRKEIKKIEDQMDTTGKERKIQKQIRTNLYSIIQNVIDGVYKKEEIPITFDDDTKGESPVWSCFNKVYEKKNIESFGEKWCYNGWNVCFKCIKSKINTEIILYKNGSYKGMFTYIKSMIIY